MRKLRVLDLFSGIGGFSLGLERSGGFETVAFCEIEPYCRKVLAKHWPHVRCYDDVRILTADALSRDGIVVDAICGGFPCQDISLAGKGAGLAGERSGLWGEYARLIGELRPAYAIVENVAALLGRGLERVLGDLVALGYDAEWHCIPAAYVGAPHRRDRVWIVAYASGDELRQQPRWRHGQGRPGPAFAGEHGPARSVANADQPRLEGRLGRGVRERAGECTARTSSASVADAARLQSGREEQRPERQRIGTGSEPLAMANAEGGGWAERNPDGRRGGEGNGADQWAGPAGGGWWQSEPDVGRVAHGVPQRVDRLKALGNAVVPQIPELIGRAIRLRVAA
jgi:DNA (cytosine-5)-methyltransferase 1